MTKGQVSLEQAIDDRRSIREFKKEALTLEEISQILWAAQGITDELGRFRSTPSAGALYPLELFIVTEQGIYNYYPEDHALVMLSSDDIREGLSKACVSQEFVGDAPLSIVITGVFERTRKKYGQRGDRYVYIEAGHCCQNILLEATALGLGAVPVGAFYDEELLKILNLENSYSPIYVVPIGRPRD